MIPVELAGPIGSGKSSLARPLCQALLDRGVAASLLDDVARPGRAASTAWSVVFAARHPRLALLAIRASVSAPIAWWHRRLILRLTLGVGGRLLLAARRLPKDHLVIVDEGLAHRSVNLFAWYAAVPNEGVRRYAQSVPIAGPLIVVNVSSEQARRRALRRGLPKRLAGKSESEAVDFLQKARDVVLLAADVVEQRGGTVVRVTNSRSLSRAVATAADAIVARRGQRRRSVSSTEMRFLPRSPLLSRPDHGLRRAAARRSGGLPRAVIDEVLARYGVVAVGRPRTLTAPGGRGNSVRIRSSDGELVIKRYKQSVSAASITVEHWVLSELARRDFPAPRLRRTQDDQTWSSHDGRCYAVFRFERGYRHPNDLLMSPWDRHRFDELAGRTLAQLHDLLSEGEPPRSDSLGFTERGGPRVRSVEWHIERLAKAPTPRRVRSWVEAALWELWETIDGAHPRLTVVHGDYGPQNLGVRAGEAPMVLDFELARLDWGIVDLAIALPRFARSRLGWDLPAARRMLRGYVERSGLSYGEARRIPDVLAFLSLQRAVVAWYRELGSGDGTWDAEARRLVTLAETLIAHRHPLNAAVAA